MKRHIQEFGVKPWAGQDLLDLQSEPFKVLDSFFQEYGPCIIKGCEITPEGNLFSVSPGLVALAGKDSDGAATFKAVPFAGAGSVTLPLYLTLTHTIVTRPYADKKVRPIACDYQATATTVQPTDVPFLEITATGARRFVDAIKVTEKLDKTGNGRDVSVTFAEATERVNIASGEKLSVLFSKIAKWLAGLKTVAFTGKAADLEQDTTHRLVTDAEKTAWADKYTKAQTYTRTEVEQKIAAIVDSAPGTLDTLKELAAALGNDPNFATSIMALIGGKADTVHAHTIANVTSLQSALDGKIDNVGRLKIWKGEHFTGSMPNGVLYNIEEGGEHVFVTKGRYAFETTPEGGKLNKNNIWHAGNFNPDHISALKAKIVLEDEAIPEKFDSFQVFHVTNSSTGGMDGYIWAQRWSGGNYVTQIYTDVDSTNLISIRTRNNDGVWTPWQKLITQAQLNLKADASHTHTGVYAPANHTHAGTMRVIIAGHVSADGQRMDDSAGPLFQASLTGDIYTVIHSRGNSNYHVTLTGGKGNGRGGHVYASLIEKGTTYFKVKTADDDSPNIGDFYFTMYEIV